MCHPDSFGLPLICFSGINFGRAVFKKTWMVQCWLLYERMYEVKRKMTAATVLIFSLFVLIACTPEKATDVPEFEGLTWMLTGINNESPMEGAQLTLKFEGGQVSGNAGCNSYGGNYVYEGDGITFSDLYSTEMYCMEPDGVMEQEQRYLELLRKAQRIELFDGSLAIDIGQDRTLTFETLSSIVVAETRNTDLPYPTSSSTVLPPAGFKEYQDTAAGISVFIPESWYVTGVIEGEYAILQSYPEDKYIGGEGHEPGDTKCDLNIQPPEAIIADLVRQWESDSRTTILSEREITLQSREPAIRFELDSMGRANVVVTIINERVVLLTCFGDFTLFDQVVDTLREMN